MREEYDTKGKGGKNKTNKVGESLEWEKGKGSHKGDIT